MTVRRFLSRDAWPYDFQNPLELNRYVYAANNPVRWTDPSGYSVFDGAAIKRSISIGSLGGLTRLGQSIAHSFKYVRYLLLESGRTAQRKLLRDLIDRDSRRVLNPENSSQSSEDIDDDIGDFSILEDVLKSMDREDVKDQVQQEEPRLQVALGLSLLGSRPILEIFAAGLSNTERQVVPWEEWYMAGISEYEADDIKVMNALEFRAVVTPIIVSHLASGTLHVNLEGVEELFGVSLRNLSSLLGDYESTYEGGERSPFIMELSILNEQVDCENAKFYLTAARMLALSEVDICN